MRRRQANRPTTTADAGLLARGNVPVDATEEIFVTLTIADQLFGMPVLPFGTCWATRRSPVFRWPRRKSRAA